MVRALVLVGLLAAALAPAALAKPGAKPAPRGGSPIAPERACPNQTDRSAPAPVQRAAMLCMTNYARATAGLKPLVESRPLARAAVRKSADILVCDQFSHEACGREFTYWMGRFGYLEGCWSAAENIAWGTGSRGSVRGIFAAWIGSPGHRENILGPYAQVGTAFARGTVEGSAGATVWTQDFGSHLC